MPKVIPFTGLLDTYSGAAAAYSLRKLRSAYSGSAIRVRRSSDNTEQNIGFVDNVLDTTSLLSFCGSGDGFVTTWYDQSGNANNALTNSAIQQPQIVSSGSVLTVNSKPCLLFDGGNDFLELLSTINVGSSSYNSFVGKRDASARRLIGLTSTDNASYLWTLWSDNNYYLQGKSTHYQVSNATDTTTSQVLLTGLNNAGTMQMFKNSNTIASSQVSFTLNLTIKNIGQYVFNNWVNGRLQEIVFYNSNQVSNRTGIETNINSFYTIY